MNKKNTSKKAKQAKNLRHSKKFVGDNKADCKVKIPTDMLYMWSGKSIWCKLADRAYVAEGKFGGIFEVRFENLTSTGLLLQYKFGRKWRSILLKDVKGDRTGSNGTTRKRQTSKRKSLRSLRSINRGIYKDIKFPKDWGKLNGE